MQKEIMIFILITGNFMLQTSLSGDDLFQT